MSFIGKTFYSRTWTVGDEGYDPRVCKWNTTKNGGGWYNREQSIEKADRMVRISHKLEHVDRGCRYFLEEKKVLNGVVHPSCWVNWADDFFYDSDGICEADLEENFHTAIANYMFGFGMIYISVDEFLLSNID